MIFDVTEAEFRKLPAGTVFQLECPEPDYAYLAEGISIKMKDRHSSDYRFYCRELDSGMLDWDSGQDVDFVGDDHSSFTIYELEDLRNMHRNLCEVIAMMEGRGQ